jgi:uracil-DNA glycosylase
MKLPVEKVHASWKPFFQKHNDLLESIFDSLQTSHITPSHNQIFRAFEDPLEQVRVVIFGQDPYPGVNVADGLAFSSPPHQSIPASLRNIFKEYHSDLGYEIPTSPDLTSWSQSGVLLLNRTLTTVTGERNAHVAKGWSDFTLEAAKMLGEREVVAILWGNYAKELAPFFAYRIESAHPSPLSARLGFFGSTPFSRSNDFLGQLGREPINWKL